MSEANTLPPAETSNLAGRDEIILESELLRLSQQLFAGDAITIENEPDPEFPRDSYTVVEIVTSRDMGDALGRCSQWHERARQLAGISMEHIRLSIVPE